MDFKWLIFLLFSQYFSPCIFCVHLILFAAAVTPRHTVLPMPLPVPLSTCSNFFPLINPFSEFTPCTHTHCAKLFRGYSLFSHTHHSTTTRALCLHFWNDEWINYAASQMHGNVLLLPFLRFHIGNYATASQPVSTLRFNRTIVELLNCFSFCQFVGCWLMAAVVGVMLLLVFFLSLLPTETITSIVIVP